MKHLQNLHTHCDFCDGKDTMEEMARAAYCLGFDSLGFSSHTCMPFSRSKALGLDRMLEYFAEIERLRRLYEGKMEIYTGLELEMMSPIDLSDYTLDYVIGSCHYFHIGDEYVGFDRNAQEVRRVIDTYFQGDGMEYAKAYYRMLAALPERAHIDIIGHFDLITKHAENVCYFDESSPVYRKAVLEAMDALVEKIPLMEINTGAIARGYRTTPYPSRFILNEWYQRGGYITLSSDCHDRTKLTTGFAESLKMAADCGYREIYYYTREGFKSQPI